MGVKTGGRVEEIMIKLKTFCFDTILNYRLFQKFKLLRYDKFNHLRFVCFDRKHCVRIVFLVFQCLVASEKMSQMKTIFDQHKKYGLFLEIVFH